jgi:chromate transport protein ChrA
MMTNNAEAARTVPGPLARTIAGGLGSILLMWGCSQLAGYAGLTAACGAILVLEVLCAQIEAAIRGVP